jgi:hypothetical protein
MVEYEPVQIGGQMYICPRKSVTVTTAIAQIVRQGCFGAVGVTNDCAPLEAFRPKDTAINDTEYYSYHVFRSEMRILPAESKDQQNISPPDSPAPAPLAAPRP